MIAANAIGNLTNTMYATPDGDPVASNNSATATASMSIPSNGSATFITLQSDAGDYIGQGATELDTAANSTISVTGSGAQATVGVGGWSGSFDGMNSVSQLQPGYYPGLMRNPFNNPATRGLDWSGNGRGCNTLTGWFVVDSVTYTGGALSSLSLRFEQHCEGGTAVLHGQVHWTSGSSRSVTH
jgi:hypothetical protein